MFRTHLVLKRTRRQRDNAMVPLYPPLAQPFALGAFSCLVLIIPIMRTRANVYLRCGGARVTLHLLLLDAQ
jgi:hypothetical protein